MTEADKTTEKLTTQTGIARLSFNEQIIKLQ